MRNFVIGCVALVAMAGTACNKTKEAPPLAVASFDAAKAGEVKAFVAEIERFCRGKRGEGWERERDYLLRNARAGRLDYAKARRAKLPMGSGTMESAIRRVVSTCD